jgi:hypothetical protein
VSGAAKKGLTMGECDWLKRGNKISGQLPILPIRIVATKRRN